MVTYTNDDSKDKGTVVSNYAITDWVALNALDCDTDAVALTNRVLGTLILDLIKQGILKGTVTTA